MEVIINKSKVVGREMPGEDDPGGRGIYHPVLGADDLSWDQDIGTYAADGCSPCPATPTVPCAC